MVYQWSVLMAVCVCFMLVGGENVPGEDQLPQPENLHLSWNYCSLTVHWSRPTNLDPECTVNYTVELYPGKCPPTSTEAEKMWRTVNLQHSLFTSNDSNKCISLTTNPMTCGKKPSKPVFKNITANQAFVEDLRCVYYAFEKVNCTWNSNALDLNLFYRKNTDDSSKPCASYITDGSSSQKKKGCHLTGPVNNHDNLCFIFNGTGFGHPMINVFQLKPTVILTKPKVEITVENDENHNRILKITSLTPNFKKECLKYKLRVSKCNKAKTEPKIIGPVEDPIHRLDYDASCKYMVQVQTLSSNYCFDDSESAFSEPVYYGENIDPNYLLIVAIIVMPIMLSCSLILALVLFRRHKDIFFQKIPDPKPFFKDMLNSNNDGGLSKGLIRAKLYVPIKENVEQEVSLVPKTVP